MNKQLTTWTSSYVIMWLRDLVGGPTSLRNLRLMNLKPIRSITLTPETYEAWSVGAPRAPLCVPVPLTHSTFFALPFLHSLQPSSLTVTRAFDSSPQIWISFSIFYQSVKFPYPKGCGTRHRRGSPARGVPSLKHPCEGGVAIGASNSFPCIWLHIGSLIIINQQRLYRYRDYQLSCGLELPVQQKSRAFLLASWAWAQSSRACMRVG
jgi:hypothetical protein